ncbi:MAG: metallophosphoesterase [Candidatus Eremiobacteraeota bacterium]|nr:metallophosphoesterase [Candidatus Eremiobacteraeota bacterium]
MQSIQGDAGIRIVAAGDIACDAAHSARGGPTDLEARCHSVQTAALISALHPSAVLALGDLQYFGEDLQTFERGYGASWGAYRSITHPAVGNHEYEVPSASGYFDYWGKGVGERGKGWYSWDLGSWHFIVLNGNCGVREVGGCSKSSEQYRWLASDLSRHGRGCRLAYWHQPRFSSGPHGNDSEMADVFSALYAGGVDVVLNGHDHNYERFVPLAPSERADPRGIREFVVGTGGRNHSPFWFPPHKESATIQDTAFGVLLMTLRRTSYSWRFVPEAGAKYTDNGAGTCHRP